MDEGQDSCPTIPMSDYIDALAADAGERWQLGDGKNIQAWARKVYLESEEPIEERIFYLPPG